MLAPCFSCCKKPFKLKKEKFRKKDLTNSNYIPLLPFFLDFSKVVHFCLLRMSLSKWIIFSIKSRRREEIKLIPWDIDKVKSNTL